MSMITREKVVVVWEKETVFWELRFVMGSQQRHIIIYVSRNYVYFIIIGFTYPLVN
ncbi:hypothetical protein JHK86_033121 [Glycine max]|nr:hypothetical protein JHK86_033121 [Glycine max]